MLIITTLEIVFATSMQPTFYLQIVVLFFFISLSWGNRCSYTSPTSLSIHDLIFIYFICPHDTRQLLLWLTPSSIPLYSAFFLTTWRHYSSFHNICPSRHQLLIFLGNAWYCQTSSYMYLVLIVFTPIMPYVYLKTHINATFILYFFFLI